MSEPAQGGAEETHADEQGDQGSGRVQHGDGLEGQPAEENDGGEPQKPESAWGHVLDGGIIPLPKTGAKIVE